MNLHSTPELADILDSTRVATIYGPNGSGKSRFVEALAFMRDFVIESASSAQAGDPIDVEPFCFDSQSLTKPTRFEIAFIQKGTVYEYGFTVDNEKVWDEWLFARPPGGRIQRWFQRDFNPSSGKHGWTFGPSFTRARAKCGVQPLGPTPCMSLRQPNSTVSPCSPSWNGFKISGSPGQTRFFLCSHLKFS